MSEPGSKGILFVISAPSGTGKTTVATMILSLVDDLRKTVSHTTRKIRDGEENGVDYHFVDEERFLGMIGEGDFIEWAQVFGNYYGTSAREIESSLALGHDLLLVIDVQGAASVRSTKSFFSRTIFLLPPSMEELERRLVGRGQDSPESIRMRLESAAGEMGHRNDFDYQVVNDKLTSTVEEVRDIILAEREKHRGGKGS
ncbi:MAG: guanylate kinase [Nitrospinota bacterium]|nr:guanylate kinase [Nitrospinota bacterium]